VKEKKKNIRQFSESFSVVCHFAEVNKHKNLGLENQQNKKHSKMGIFFRRTAMVFEFLFSVDSFLLVAISTMMKKNVEQHKNHQNKTKMLIKKS
jgi:preprotein translocase subunit SecG